MNEAAENRGREGNAATVTQTAPQNGECPVWISTRDAETPNEVVPGACEGELRSEVGGGGGHELLRFFEPVRFEECPCENGVGSEIGGEIVEAEEVDDEVEFAKVEEEEEEAVDGFGSGSETSFQ